MPSTAKVRLSVLAALAAPLISASKPSSSTAFRKSSCAQV